MVKFNTGLRSEKELNYSSELENYINDSPFGGVDKFQNFPMFTPRQALTVFLCKHEIFKKVLDVQGSIIECGVLFGGGTMEWAQLSAIYEPYNYQRKIYAFDTFEGFPSLTDTDKKSHTDKEIRIGGMGINSYTELSKSIELYDMNRPIGHVPKVKLIRGDARETIPQFKVEHPHLIVSLLYLDFDLEEPTFLALKEFLPLMPKGAVIGFDEINNPKWPGETKAVFDAVGIRNLRIQRFPFASFISYAVLE